ncbi:MAG: hypothetical protein ACK4VO_12800 [Pseudobdellovibrio sp.]|tara:strand:- start:191728 stop:192174 length:447 start_codon:yes stop_codon:yes gene_type:complete
MNTELKSKLEKLALIRSKPFCYTCYQGCPNGVCNKCHSDELMRVTENGCEYGLDWIIEEILQLELSPIDLSEAFEESVRSTLESETITVGWMTLNAITVMKDQDPISWECAQSEYESAEETEGNIISFDNGSTYYWTHDVEVLVEDLD